MLKKVLVVAVIAAVGVFALRTTKIGSHVRQTAEEVRTWAEDQVPPEAEIKRLEGEVKALDNEISRVITQLSDVTVEARHQAREVADLRTKQAGRLAALKDNGAKIKSATEKVSYDGSMISVEAATQRLAADRAQYDALQTLLKGRETALATQEKNCEVLQRQLEAIKEQKGGLKSALDTLAVRVKVLQLQQMESKQQTDSTRMAGIKESISALEKRLDKQELALQLTNGGAPAAKLPAGRKQNVDDILSGLEDGPKPEPKAIKASD